MNIVTKFQVPIFKNEEVRISWLRGLRGIGLKNIVYKTEKYWNFFQDILKSVSSMQLNLLPETELMDTNYTTNPASNRPIFSSRPGIWHIHLYLV